MSRRAPSREAAIALTGALVIAVAHAISPTPGLADGSSAVVGSKAFTESVVLGELLRIAAREQGIAVDHRMQLGGSRILFEGLRTGDIDAYPEYSGTLVFELLGRSAESWPDAEELAAELAALGLASTRSLGFQNTYALGMKRQHAETLGIGKVSDLRRHPELKLGFSNEFMDRKDGWPGLSRAYDLEPDWVRGIDHDLAYRALESGDIDVIDLYSTDADIAYYDLVTLEDDRAYFPEYRSIYLYRLDLAQRVPELVDLLRALEGRIDEAAMIRMNGRVKLEGVSEARAASEFLGVASNESESSRLDRLLRTSWEHLTLVGISLFAAIVIAIPLGIVAARVPRLGTLVLGVTSVLQTLPSLALFVFMIPLFGIGALPAGVALFLYSLLPIVRNTHSGLTGIDPALRDSALALGLPGMTRLRWIELPLASGSIVAGIKTAAVINVGTATLAALIGAGGYGQPILTGIRLDDMSLILEGAIPAALLALAAQALFGLIEQRLGWSNRD